MKAYEFKETTRLEGTDLVLATLFSSKAKALRYYDLMLKDLNPNISKKNMTKDCLRWDLDYDSKKEFMITKKTIY